LFSNNVLKTSINSGYLQSSNIFFNELFRIGGLKTLRGFDEQSIFASQYGILNVEWRYLVQQNSNFVLFWNGAWYKNEGRKPAISDTPWGAGLGLNIETGSGIFSLYYATGKQFDNPLEFRTAKIHFGFINYF
jgi:hemolysin activation/secretion protein